MLGKGKKRFSPHPLKRQKGQLYVQLAKTDVFIRTFHSFKSLSIYKLLQSDPINSGSDRSSKLVKGKLDTKVSG